MSRIKLKLPQKFIFSTYIDIRITDINYGGHLGNDSVLGIIHEARIRFLANKGFTEGDIAGAGIIMTDAVIQYSSEGFYGDKLKIEIAVDDVTSRSCDLFYRITNSKNGKEVVKAKTNILFFDYATKKPARIPDAFLKAYEVF